MKSSPTKCIILTLHENISNCVIKGCSIFELIDNLCMIVVVVKVQSKTAESISAYEVQ